MSSITSSLIYCFLFLATLNLGKATSDPRGGGDRDPSENEVDPLLPMEDEAGSSDGGNGFTLSSDPTKQKDKSVFRLSSRLAVAVCDSFDKYLSTGRPYLGIIKYNATLQQLRSPVPPNTCQSFRIKRCSSLGEGGCGWTKVSTC